MDGTYVVEGEYLVTVERLSAADPRHEAIKQLAPPVETPRKEPDSPPSSSDDERNKNVNMVKTMKSISFISKLRTSFKSKQKLKISKPINSDDVKDDGPDREILPVVELSRSLKHDGSDTADEVDDLMYDELNVSSKVSSSSPSSSSSNSKQAKPDLPIISPPSVEKKLQAPVSSSDGKQNQSRGSSDHPSKEKTTKTSSASSSSGKPHESKPSSSDISKPRGTKSHSSCSSSNKSSSGTTKKNSSEGYNVNMGVGSPKPSSKSTSSSRSKPVSHKEHHELEKTIPRISLDIMMMPGTPDKFSPSDSGQTESVIYDQVEEHKIEVESLENDLNVAETEKTKPKLSFLNKLKKSFKSSSDKKPVIPKLDRPPSVYMSSNSIDQEGSIRTISQASLSSNSKPPVVQLLAKNPEMCSNNSLHLLNSLKANEEYDAKLSHSPSTNRSRSNKRGTRSKRRSRSLTKLIGNVINRKKSLTDVTPINGGSDNEYDPNKPIPRLPKKNEDDAEKPKKRLSFVGKLKKRLSIGKGDVDRKREQSKSVPNLMSCTNPPSDHTTSHHITRTRSIDNVSQSSETSMSTDVRTQIVVKSAKINRRCGCHMCVLVRRNIKNHYTAQPHLDPTQKHRYEVVLKMNVIGTDFLNPECGGEQLDPPDSGRYRGAAAQNGGESVGDPRAGCDRDQQPQQQKHDDDRPHDSPHIRTRTQSEIDDLAKDFNEETRSSSTSTSRTSLSELQITSPNPASRQSTV